MGKSHLGYGAVPKILDEDVGHLSASHQPRDEVQCLGDGSLARLGDTFHAADRHAYRYRGY